MSHLALSSFILISTSAPSREPQLIQALLSQLQYTPHLPLIAATGLSLPSKMSFSSLPPELVRQIIESSVPSTYHSTTYGKGQSTLRSLCLTERRFLPIAQTLLRETIELDKKDKIAMATTGAISGRWGDAVRHLVFRWTAGEARLGVNLEELASTFSNCVSLTISTELEGTKLAHMSHFRSESRRRWRLVPQH